MKFESIKTLKHNAFILNRVQLIYVKLKNQERNKMLFYDNTIFDHKANLSVI